MTDTPARRDPRRWVVAAILAVGGVAAIVLAARMGDLLNATYRFSDAPAAPLIGNAIGTRDVPVVVPTQTAIGMLWIDAAIAGLPAHHAMELVLGPLIALIGVVLLALATRRVGGRRASLIALAMAAAIPPTVIWTITFQDNHVSTVATAALLGWHLVRLSATQWNAKTAIVSVIVGLFAGIGYASDPQLLVAGMLPFVASLVITWRCRPAARLPFRAAGVTVAALVVTDLIAQGVMAAQQVQFLNIFAPHPDATGIVRGATLSARGLTWMGDGQWYGGGWAAVVVIGVLAAGMMVALPVLELRSALRMTGGDEPSTRRILHVLYWGLAFYGLVGALIVSGASSLDVQAHYISGCFFCTAALAPLALTRVRGRALVAGGALVCGVMATNTVSVATIDTHLFSTSAVAPESDGLVSLLETHHLTRGFAGYWEAYDITWRSEGTVQAWPVSQGRSCAGQGTTSLCAHGFSAAGPFRPRGGQTFLITRRDGTDCFTAPPDASIYGVPTATYRLGVFTVLVYADDVSQHFVPSVDPFCS